MHIKSIAAMLALLPAMVSAQTVASPDGNVSLTFSLTDNGRPTYEMSYKGKKVINPSHLYLALDTGTSHDGMELHALLVSELTTLGEQFLRYFGNGCAFYLAIYKYVVHCLF